MSGMRFPDFRALPVWTWHPSNSHPARGTSTLPVWVGGPVRVRFCTSCVTAGRAGAASLRVRLPTTRSAAYRVRYPSERYGCAQYLSHTCP